MTTSTHRPSLAAALGLLVPLLGCGRSPPAPTWTPAGSMRVGRLYASAAPLKSASGEVRKVMVLGGTVACLHALNCYNEADQQDTALVDLYDPVTGTWTAAASMYQTRSRAAAVSIPAASGCASCGKVLVAGGLSGVSGVLDNADLYDPEKDAWSPVQGMRQKRSWPAAEWLESAGKVLVTGGVNQQGLVASGELFDPRTGEWSETAPMNGGRWAHAAAMLGSGKVLVAGGRTYVPGCQGFCPLTASAELYDPAADTWTPTGDMFQVRDAPTAVVLLSGRVLVVCGAGATAEIYDPDTGSWLPARPMVFSRTYCTATRLPSGQVLVVGGGVTGAELYDPATDMWRAAGQISTTRYGHVAALLSSGRVLVAGGMNVDQTLFLSSAELFSLE